MKKKDLNTSRSKSLEDLGKLVLEKKQELAKWFVKETKAKGKDVKVAKNLRRDIAQIKTIMKEKELIAKIEQKKEKAKGDK